MNVESRCGLLCSACGYYEQRQCPGCTARTKPFWAQACPVKSCCEVKGFPHCGRCDAFPCDLLKSFAYDKEQGDNGRRIQQCALWKETQQ